MERNASSFESSSATVTDTSALTSLLGAKLASSSGTVATANMLAGKIVGLYFSAHWCPPCRGFTPKLVEAYKKHLKAKGMEIVFVSSDQNESAFKSYFCEMPWLALPFSERKIKAQLSEKFGVQGIPTLVLLNSDGTLLAKDGRAKVMKDPKGSWMPSPTPAGSALATLPKVAGMAPALLGGGLGALLGDEFIGTDGVTRVSLSEVSKHAPLIALYFSAHWCGPCRSFTPKLVTFVEMLREEGIELPVIFGSSDQDQASFADYFATMPWYAFPHADRRIEELKSKYSVSGIPWLVVLDAEGNLVVNEADTMVPQGTPAYHAWIKRAKKQPTAGAPAA